ncbi:MAG: Eco57I restriction-modification methylase domain-containing protein [Christensenellaceae bacterium]|nr:Eco57I restriction-modification methylase domain-containing protein [Christensenellaceae bacterium]
MLQKIVYLLEEIDPDSNLWFDKVCTNVPNLVVDELKKKFDSGLFNYIRKLIVIQNSIHGIDIQPIAIEIAKLRCFLSIIIEEKVSDFKDNRGINPLPNLEFKFVVANSLIILNPDGQTSLFTNVKHECDLETLRKKYFSAQPGDRNKLREKYDTITNEMRDSIKKHNLEKNTRYHQLVSWSPFTNTATEWFDPKWMFGLDRFDIVIANPPYITLQKLSKSDPKVISKMIVSKKNPIYETYTGSADLYCLFYERGLKLLKDNGYLTYITSNVWIKSGYGMPLRNLFLKNYDPINLIDLGPGRFSSASVATNIITIKNAPYSLSTRTLDHTKLNLNLLKNFLKTKSNVCELKQNELFTILTPIEFSIRKKLNTNAITLREWRISVYSGIKTAYDKAFLIKGDVRQRIISKDPQSDEILTPVLRGRDINKEKINFANEYLITTHNGYYDDQHNRIPAVNINDYPVVMTHLDKYLDKLKKRSDKGKSPYNLRDCAYMNEFFKPKIIYRRISDRMNAVVDNDGYIVINTCFIITGEYINFLCSFFNCNLFKLLFKDVGALGGKGRNFITNIKVIKPTGEDRAYTDQEFYKLYNLSDDEIEYIESLIHNY